MSDPINLYEAKTHLSTLVDRAEAGEEIIIAKSGTPRARLVQLARSPRRPGGWENGVWMADDFDAPLPPDILQRFAGTVQPAVAQAGLPRGRRRSPRPRTAGT
jgi:prevent-host-death family protein